MFRPLPLWPRELCRRSSKGRNGGKFRRIPARRDTKEIFEDFLRYRKGIVKGRPDERILLVHFWKGSLKEYGKTGIDKILVKLSLRAGVKFSNHDLRRTFGRRMYGSGVAIKEIASILGHEDTKMTLMYLGLEHDDLSDAKEKYYQYDQKTVFPNMEILDVS